ARIFAPGRELELPRGRHLAVVLFDDSSDRAREQIAWTELGFDAELSQVYVLQLRYGNAQIAHQLREFEGQGERCQVGGAGVQRALEAFCERAACGVQGYLDVDFEAI